MTDTIELPIRSAVKVVMLAFAAAFVLVVISMTSCTTIKPIARTVNDIAHDMCANYFSEKQGISFEDAARTVCNAQEIVDPFLRELLKAQAAAGVAAEGARSGVAPDAGEDAAAEPRPSAIPTTVIIVVRKPDAESSDAAAE